MEKFISSEARNKVPERSEGVFILKAAKNKTFKESEGHFVIYTDGASRGNPGPSSIGVAICDKKEKPLKTYAEQIEDTTNNVAEYKAVIFAIKKIKALYGKKMIKNCPIEIRSDSQLLISQLNGKYKILEPKIQNLFIEIWNLKIDLGKIVFSLIPREKNQIADALANEALDRQNKKLF